MKKVIVILVMFIYHLGYTQEVTPANEQLLENTTAAEDIETEDDAYLQQLDYLRRHPLNLNTAETQQLEELMILSDAQISSLLSYRNILGLFIDIHELQAVPLWDLQIIHRLRPLVYVGPASSVKENITSRLRDGERSLLFRVAQVLERAKGFDSSIGDAAYLGSRQRVHLRYKYSFKNLLSYGILGEKDAGECFFKGVQKMGFDFYSFFLFARKLGRVEAIALGDFTVNMGQGLIQWQSLAFRKSAEIVSVKRQSPVLRPYNSAGEFNFQRGIGITYKIRNIEATVFGSLRKLNANLETDSLNRQNVTSFLSSGNNRNANEIEDRYTVQRTGFGSSIKWQGLKGKVALNIVHYNFSLPVQKRDEPYNLYAWKGKSWSNASIDYSYGLKNFHFFGEAAIDKNLNSAFIHGMLISADAKVDVSLLHRHIQPGYQAVNASAFTENSSPSNEQGIFMGLAFRPFKGWRMDFYTDIYAFPWLKYLVDAPTNGNDLMMQVIHTVGKQVEIVSRFRQERSMKNKPGGSQQAVVKYPATQVKRNWRLQVNYILSPSVTLRQRVEINSSKWEKDSSYSGFLTFCDVIFKPMLKPYSVVLRWQYFDTDGYDARVYVYENDVLYSYSIPAMFDTGLRYYATLGYDVTKRLSFWLRWAQTIYHDKSSIGSGTEEISGHRKSELKCQVRWFF